MSGRQLASHSPSLEPTKKTMQSDQISEATTPPQVDSGAGNYTANAASGEPALVQGYVKSTRAKIVGTLETIPGICHIQEFVDGEPVFMGHTEINWNGQRTVTDCGGTAVYVCENGVHHHITEIEFK